MLIKKINVIVFTQLKRYIHSIIFRFSHVKASIFVSQIHSVRKPESSRTAAIFRSCWTYDNSCGHLFCLSIT